jgi:phage gp16-like protein
MNREQAIKLIHVARRDLAIDDDAWRELLQQKFHVASSRELGISDLYKLVEHLKKCGFKIRHPGKKPGAARSRPLAGAAQKRPGEPAKIRALWLFMHHELGLVKDPSEAALAAYVKRITRVDALQWLDGQQTYRVIESLKKWAERVFEEKLRKRIDAFLVARLIPGPMPDKELQERLCAALVKVVEGRDRSASGRAPYDACLAAWEVMDAVMASMTPTGARGAPLHPGSSRQEGELCLPSVQTETGQK